MADHAAIAAGLAPVEGKDVFAIFKGYAQPLEEGQEPILQPGDPVKVVRLEKDADIVVVKVDEDGNEIMNGDTPVAETLFPEELEPATMDEPEGTDAVAEETAPADTFTEATPEELAKQSTRPKADEPAPAEAEKPKPTRRRKADAAPAAETPAPAPAAEEKPAEQPAADKPKGRIRKAATTEAAPAADAKAEEKPAAAKSEVKPTPVVQIKDMVSVTEAISGNGGDALRAAKALVDRAEQTDMTLGGVLRSIHETGIFKTLGYDGKRGFDDYVEKTLGILSRKARYLMSIYTKFAMLGVDEAKLNEIGWSKAKELARIPDAELKKDFNKLTKLAKEKSRDDLIGHIKTKYEVVTRGEQVQTKSFSFRLAEADGHTVEEGLKEACTAIGEQDNNKALAHIVGEWRGQSSQTEMDLDAMLELAMARFGLQSISFKDAQGEEFVVDAPAAEGEATQDADASADAEATA